MSALHDRLVEYLAVRRALGFKLERAEAYLRDFVGYLELRGEPQITIKRAVAWAVLPGGCDSLHYARLAAVRLFAAYLHTLDPSIEVPGVELLRNRPPRRRPFLYTNEEILALMAAARDLENDSPPGDLQDSDRPAGVDRDANRRSDRA